MFGLQKTYEFTLDYAYIYRIKKWREGINKISKQMKQIYPLCKQMRCRPVRFIGQTFHTILKIKMCKKRFQSQLFQFDIALFLNTFMEHI